MRRSAHFPSCPAETEAPRERRRLELKPRSDAVPKSNAPASQFSASPVSPTEAPKKKFDPFGGARPVDVTSVEKRVEEKLKQREAEERRKAEEAKKKAEEEAAKAAVSTEQQRSLHERPTGKERATESMRSKAEEASSWRSQKPVGERPAEPKRAWQQTTREEAPKPETSSKQADDLVPKMNAFSILGDDEVSFYLTQKNKERAFHYKADFVGCSRAFQEATA